MQQIAVDEIGVQIFEGTGKRLGNLRRQAGRRIVRQPMVLTFPVSEFRLQKKIRARYHSGAVRGLQTITHPFLEVMTALIRSVDTPEAGADRKLGEGRGSFFFPGCTVEELGDQVLLYGHFVVVKTKSVPQSSQLFTRFKILDGVSARTCEIVIGDGVRHAPQI